MRVTANIEVAFDVTHPDPSEAGPTADYAKGVTDVVLAQAMGRVKEEVRTAFETLEGVVTFCKTQDTIAVTAGETTRTPSRRTRTVDRVAATPAKTQPTNSETLTQ